MVKHTWACLTILWLWRLKVNSYNSKFIKKVLIHTIVNNELAMAKIWGKILYLFRVINLVLKEEVLWLCTDSVKEMRLWKLVLGKIELTKSSSFISSNLESMLPLPVLFSDKISLSYVLYHIKSWIYSRVKLKTL